MGTARNLTIGSTGKSVNGSANVSWSLAEIGAASTAQGALADTAVQPGSLATVATTGSYNDLADIPANITAWAGIAPSAKADASHTHTIANVIGLQGALDDKVNKTGDTMTGVLNIIPSSRNDLALAVRNADAAHNGAAPYAYIGLGVGGAGNYDEFGKIFYYHRDIGLVDGARIDTYGWWFRGSVSSSNGFAVHIGGQGNIPFVKWLDGPVGYRPGGTLQLGNTYAYDWYPGTNNLDLIMGGNVTTQDSKMRVMRLSDSKVFLELNEAGYLKISGQFRPGTFVTSAAPVTPDAGSTVYLTDAKKIGETTGTGVPVYYSEGTWRRYSDDAAVGTDPIAKEPVFSKGSLVAGAGVSLSGTLTDRLVGSGNITITATSSGTVTSVNLANSTGLTASGGPVTGAGSLTYTLSANLQAWHALATNSKQDTLTSSTSNTVSGTQVQRAALTGDVTAAANSNATTIANGVVTLAKMANMDTGSVFYRKTAGTGVPEVQTLATLKTDLGLTGTNSGDQTITLTGAVTGSGTGGFATTLSTGVVTNANLSSVATATIKGRVSASTGVVEDLTAADVRGMLNVASGATVGADWSTNLTGIPANITAWAALAPSAKADSANTITAGNGLTGGGDLTASRTLTLGTPGSTTLASTNAVTSTSHTHAFAPGGTNAQYIRGDGTLATFPSIPAGTVTSVAATVPTGLQVSGSPITSSGTLAITYQSGYQGFTTAEANTIANLGSTYIPLSQKGAVNGVATLDANQKIPQNQLPAIAITDTFVVASQSAMLALTAEVGDVAVRSDISKSFILRVEPASTLANWQELLTPATGVTSVAMSVPTGLSIAGSPITSTGTLALTYAAGYQGYTTTEAGKLSGIADGATVGADWNTNLSNIPANIIGWAGYAPENKVNSGYAFNDAFTSPIPVWNNLIYDLNNLLSGHKTLANHLALNVPPMYSGATYYYVESRATYVASTSVQIAHSYNATSPEMLMRHYATVWSPWVRFWNSGNFANGDASQYIRGDGSLATLDYAAIGGTVPTWNQNTTGSAATLTTPRTLTIGSTGKTFNGGANVSWSLAEIGALPLTGGTLTGAVTGTTAEFTTVKMRLPSIVANANTTFSTTHLNCIVKKNNTTAYTYTIPSALGTDDDTITVFNAGSSNDITVVGSSVTLYENGLIVSNVIVKPYTSVTFLRAASGIWVV